MRINCINNICTNTKFQGKVTKPIQNVANKPVETVMGMTALSGLYLTLKAVQGKKEKEQNLNNLGLEQHKINSILKNSAFNNDAVKILSEVSKLEDKTFYSNIIDNTLSINSFQQQKTK